MISSHAKRILNVEKFVRKLKELSFGEAYAHLSQDGTTLEITFNRDLDSGEQEVLSYLITNFIDYETADQLVIYLKTSVNPFVENLLATFAAENIAMGITQSGKTPDVLGMFVKPVLLSGSMHSVSLKSCLDTGSLYVAKEVIQWFRDNDSQWTTLSPFITEPRLLKLKNEIEAFLKIPLST